MHRPAKSIKPRSIRNTNAALFRVRHSCLWPFPGFHRIFPDAPPGLWGLLGVFPGLRCACPGLLSSCPSGAGTIDSLFLRAHQRRSSIHNFYVRLRSWAANPAFHRRLPCRPAIHHASVSSKVWNHRFVRSLFAPIVGLTTPVRVSYLD